MAEVERAKTTWFPHAGVSVSGLPVTRELVRFLTRSRCTAPRPNSIVVSSLDISQVLFFCLLRFLWQGQGGLTKHIAPSIWAADVGVAVPKNPLKGFSTVRTFPPQLGGDHGSVAPKTDRLVRTVLMFVDDARALGFLK